MSDNKELEKWARWIQFLLTILGGGGVVGLLITLSELEFCRRILIAIAVIALTLALVTFLRLWLKAKNRPKNLLPNELAPPLVKYLAKNARSLLLSEVAFIFIFSLCSFLFVFPETMNAIPICTITPPTITITPTPDCFIIRLDVNVTEVNADVVVSASGNVVFEGTSINGTINICVPYSYDGLQIDLEVTADGYSPYTKGLFVDTSLPPQSIDLQPIPSQTPTPMFTLTPIPTSTKTPTPLVVVDTNSLIGWVPIFDSSNGDNTINAVKINEDEDAIEFTYNVGQFGYVVITHSVNPRVLSDTEGISFLYKGRGAPNSIEFKLLLKYPDFDEHTTYGFIWDRATDTGNKWIKMEVLYRDMRCWWPEENCDTHGDLLDITMVDKLDFVVVCKPGNLPGSGWVLLKDVLGIRP